MKIYLRKVDDMYRAELADTNSYIALRHLLDGGTSFHTMDFEEVEILAKMHGCELIVVDN